MTDYATVEDVEALWGQPIPADSSTFTQVSALLSGAHAIVRSRVPTIDARVLGGTVPADVVRYIIAEMVIGVLRNPDGLKMEMAGVFQRQIDTNQASARMSLNDDQLQMLGEFKGGLNLDLRDDAIDTGRPLVVEDPLAGRDRRHRSRPDGWV